VQNSSANFLLAIFLHRQDYEWGLVLKKLKPCQLAKIV
jgi:hypothetical protein